MATWEPMALRFERRRADEPDARRLVERYLDELRREIPGFDAARSTSASPAEMAPPDGAFVVAYVGDDAVACGGLKRFAPGIAEIKRMFVAPEARRRGVASRLLLSLEEAARELGCAEVVLDTAATLTAAAALYRAAGYRDVPAYNANPFAGAWFRKRLG